MAFGGAEAFFMLATPEKMEADKLVFLRDDSGKTSEQRLEPHPPAVAAARRPLLVPPADVGSETERRDCGGGAVSIDVSVVIPTFRRPALLREAIASVVAQKGAQVELIVVDDSAEGSAADVVAEFAGSARYVRNARPTGGFPSRVRNLGWPLARGRFVHFLDDDDLVPEGYYAAAKAAFAAEPQVGVVFGRVAPFGDASDAQMSHERAFFRSAARRAAICSRFGPRLGFAAGMIFNQALLVCGAALIRRPCVERLGGFDPEIQLGEDVDFFGRAMREFGARFLDREALHYRIGSPSLMHAPLLSEREIQNHLAGARRMAAKYRSERGSLEFYVMKGLSRLVLTPCAALLPCAGGSRSNGLRGRRRSTRSPRNGICSTDRSRRAPLSRRRPGSSHGGSTLRGTGAFCSATSSSAMSCGTIAAVS
jgi:glycosyltransferase involved in cell wall biosynthesis